MSWRASQAGGNIECIMPWYMMVVGPGREGWEGLFNKGQEADADISGSDT